jgi:hypothetical protein
MKFPLFIFFLCTVIICQARQQLNTVPDCLQVKSNILNLYKWHNKNCIKRALLELYKSETGIESLLYTINRIEAESGLHKETPLLTNLFILAERRAFKEKAIQRLKNIQKMRHPLIHSLQKAVKRKGEMNEYRIE